MYKEKIETIRAQVHDLNQQRNDLTSEWIEKEHPIKIGAKVKVNGSVHTGKEMIVTNRSVYAGYKEWVWKAVGPVLKKDGSQGLYYGEWEKKT